MAHGTPPTCTPRHRVVTLQATYYILTGLWPLVHFSSFELVTGPKTDDWLVRMVGLLVVLIGVTLAVAVGCVRLKRAHLTHLPGRRGTRVGIPCRADVHQSFATRELEAVVLLSNVGAPEELPA